MKFSLSWLKRHLDTNATLQEICETLTALGLEVEDVQDPAQKYAPFKVAEIVEALPHPDADKLQVLKVDTLDQKGLQVVCGAPNARAGMKGIFAPEGTYIPGLDVTLKKTSIRGVESSGMMVSEREMCLSDEHKGIIEVDPSHPVGTPMALIFGLEDPLIQINLTPNRVDCASVRGIARDLASAGLGILKPVQADAVQGSFPCPVKVSIGDLQGCPLFVGRMIRGVKNGPSPVWLQRLMTSAGLKSISALVDITNFMTQDLARPLHVYDADTLSGDIFVSASKGGERFEALNEKTYTLCEESVTIEDQSGILGLGGIMGGQSTACTEQTVNVFLESAYFTPVRIAKAGRALGIDSDARYRFERGIDPVSTFFGLEMATQMILELCGGEASTLVQAGALPQWERPLAFDPAYTAQLIGLEVPEATQRTILESLGFGVAGQKTWTVTPPSWRGDVAGKADLVEEIIRVHGFDKIPSVSVHNAQSIPACAETLLLSRARKARAALTAGGLLECVTWSFLARRHAEIFGATAEHIRALTLKNPISSEMDVMRPSILPNLLNLARDNAARGYPSAALCEVGPVFTGSRPEQQKTVASGVRTGENGVRHWSGPQTIRAVDLYDAKADAFAVLESAGFSVDSVQVVTGAPATYHPGRSGVLRLGPTVIGYFGDIHPFVLEQLEIDFPACGFEVFLEHIPEPKKKIGTERPLLKRESLQPVYRDFAFLVEEKTEAQTLVRAAVSADKALIQDAFVFDVYTGKGVDAGYKSLGLGIRIQPQNQSLTDQDLEALAEKVINAVCEKTGGSLRS